MKQSDLNTLTDEELVKRFAYAAHEMGSAVLDSRVRRANRIYDIMRAIDLVLRSRGTDSRLQLSSLLSDPDRFVRYYAAKKLLGLIPGSARLVIEWNAKYGFDAIAGDAGMTIDNLDSGFYKPD